MKKLVIIIPTLNEEKNIPKIVKRVLKVNNFFEILFIDDASTDKSQLLIKKLKKNIKKLIIFSEKIKVELDRHTKMH